MFSISAFWNAHLYILCQCDNCQPVIPKEINYLKLTKLIVYRTGATGDRAKEGISINCGLLALGNVIRNIVTIKFFNKIAFPLGF
jgi:hypothetical protein